MGIRQISVGKTLVKVNDHVYVAPMSGHHHAYTIARIIDFIPGSSSSEVHCKLAFYYRPADISHRSVADVRLLYATISTAVQPASSIRGKCYVRHRDSIQDLQEWRKYPDHFWYNRFFDSWIKSYFEVIPTDRVVNAPTKVLATLKSRFEFILCEGTFISDLTDAYRSCLNCKEWCSNTDSVKCLHCKESYHQKCLNPPLITLPAKGYGWTCHDCIEVGGRDRVTATFTRKAPLRTGQQLLNTKKSSKFESRPPNISPGEFNNEAERMWRGFPFRYFGLYTVFEDVLEADDWIYPIMPIRVGRQFTATVTSFEDGKLHQAQRDEKAEVLFKMQKGVFIPFSRKDHNTSKVQRQSGQGLKEGADQDLIVPRGMDDHSTVTLISKNIPDWTDEKIEECKRMAGLDDIEKYYTRSMDLFVSMLSRACNQREGEPDQLLEPIDWLRSTPRLTQFHLSLDEQNAFEKASRNCQREDIAHLSRVEELKHMHYGDLVEYYYRSKGREQLWDETFTASGVSTVTPSVKAKVGRPKKNARDKPASGNHSLGSADEGSLFEAASNVTLTCCSCGTRKSDKWFKGPSSVRGKPMCRDCGSYWRKYAVISNARVESVREKAIVTQEPPAKKQKITKPEPVKHYEPRLTCACCRKSDPIWMARCARCGMNVHPTCYGLLPEQYNKKWTCETCANYLSPEYHVQARCLLCPALNQNWVDEPHNINDIMKPTENKNWIHLLCSMLIPSIQFTDGTAMRLVEGLGPFLSKNIVKECGYCHSRIGFCHRCEDCEFGFHGSCARVSKCRVGFLMAVTKSEKKAAFLKFNHVADVTINKVTGVLRPILLCKRHLLGKREILDPFEIDSHTGLSVIQIYSQTYKTADSNTYGTLRKAQRLDELLERRRESEPRQSTETSQTQCCARCSVNFSPKFWRLEESDWKTGQERGLWAPNDYYGNEFYDRAVVCNLCRLEVQLPRSAFHPGDANSSQSPPTRQPQAFIGSQAVEQKADSQPEVEKEEALVAMADPATAAAPNGVSIKVEEQPVSVVETR